MTQNGKENEFAALDRELAQMAQETPEMPDDFHDRWMGQIRAEAARAKEADKKENRRQWRYVLSAAAVFVFLIGGTLLTRRNKEADRAENARAAQPVWTEPAPEPDSIAADMASCDAETEEAPEAEAFFDAANSVKSAANSATNGEALKAEKAAGVYAADFAEEAAPEELPEEAKTEAEEADMFFAEEAAYPDTLVSGEDYGAVPAEGAAMSAAAAATASVPTSAPMATVAESPAPSPLPQPAEEPRQSEFVSFLKDLGIFTLKTLAAAAACAVLVVPAVLIYRKKRKNR